MSDDLWASDAGDAWRAALERYEVVIEAQGSKVLPELDRWYRDELPGLIAARKRPHVTHSELVRVTEWKMARGIWRPRKYARYAQALRDRAKRLGKGWTPVMVERAVWASVGGKAGTKRR